MVCVWRRGSLTHFCINFFRSELTLLFCVAKILCRNMTHFCIIFLRSEMTSCSVSQKVDTEMGQAPTSQAKPQDAGLKHGKRGLHAQWIIPPPSLVMIRALRGADSWRRSSAVCENQVFLAARAGLGTEIKKPDSTTKAISCFFFFLFSDSAFFFFFNY